MKNVAAHIPSRYFTRIMQINQTNLLFNLLKQLTHIKEVRKTNNKNKIAGIYFVIYHIENIDTNIV